MKYFILNTVLYFRIICTGSMARVDPSYGGREIRGERNISSSSVSATNPF